MWQSTKHFLSTHNATSNLWLFTETILLTPLAGHRHLLRMACGRGQCFLPRSSRVATAGDLPIGLCTFRSCPACANKFPTRVNRKSLCEIFLPPHEEKKNYPLPPHQFLPTLYTVRRSPTRLNVKSLRE